MILTRSIFSICRPPFLLKSAALFCHRLRRSKLLRIITLLWGMQRQYSQYHKITKHNIHQYVHRTA